MQSIGFHGLNSVLRSFAEDLSGEFGVGARNRIGDVALDQCKVCIRRLWRLRDVFGHVEGKAGIVLHLFQRRSLVKAIKAEAALGFVETESAKVRDKRMRAAGTVDAGFADAWG